MMLATMQGPVELVVLLLEQATDTSSLCARMLQAALRLKAGRPRCQASICVIIVPVPSECTLPAPAAATKLRPQHMTG